MRQIAILFFCLLLACSSTDKIGNTYTTPVGIFVNQIGYAPQTQKIAIFSDSIATPFRLLSVKNNKEIFAGKTLPQPIWEYTGEAVSVADFSACSTPGEYILVKGDDVVGVPVTIKESPYGEVHKSALKSFYYQRASMPLTEKYAKNWSRKMGHPDDKVEVHPSAASVSRPSGTIVSAPGGWYDAGDYGKYVTPAAVSTSNMLSLYEHFPKESQGVKVNLPVNSTLPDLLVECRYSLEWLQTMQAPEGFSYHKLTTRQHAAICMPVQDREPRYLVGKSTVATLDIAAVMAQSYRVYKPFDATFADKCLGIAQRAWAWAEKNPDVQFKNPNGIGTGEYEDNDPKDERLWAAAELYISTGKKEYYDHMDVLSHGYHNPPSWRHVQPLALLSLVHHSENLDPSINPSALIQTFLAYAKRFADHAKVSPWKTPMGVSSYDFIWGSNGKCANMGMVLMYAYQLTGNPDFLNAGLGALDYILGRNPTGICFVTGVGQRSPMHIHHRPSEADGENIPIPGLLAGGPQNYFNPDDCTYPSEKPALKYVDDWCSHSTNEVAIYWNAPLVYLTGAASAL